MRILLPQMHFLLLLLSLVVVAVVVAVVVVVLLAVILIVLVVNSTSSSCGSSKILTWTGIYKSEVGAKAGKYKLRARAGKYKLGARASKYKLGAGGQGQGRRPSRGPRAGKHKLPVKIEYKILINMMENNQVFIKKYISKGNIGQMFFILQEAKNSNLLDKNCAQEDVKCHIQHEES